LLHGRAVVNTQDKVKVAVQIQKHPRSLGGTVYKNEDEWSADFEERMKAQEAALKEEKKTAIKREKELLEQIRQLQAVTYPPALSSPYYSTN
jgi:hypothetical protein